MKPWKAQPNNERKALLVNNCENPKLNTQKLDKKKKC